jgi:hypothetical protein
MIISKKQSFTVLGKTNFSQAEGIDSYKGIIVLFDQDFDQRIFVFLKNNYEALKPCVKAVYESHGNVTLYCHKTPSKAILTGLNTSVDVDSWTTSIEDIREEHVV